MGRIAPDCPSRLDAFAMIRAVLFAVVGLIFGDFAAAATVPYKFNGMNVTREGGVTYLRGTSPSEVSSATVSGSNLVVAGSSSIAGRVASFSASTPIAANAALVAVSLLKTTPATFAVGAVLTWLTTNNFQVNAGVVQKVDTSVSPPMPNALSSSDCLAMACTLGVRCSAVPAGGALYCTPARAGWYYTTGTFVKYFPPGSTYSPPWSGWSWSPSSLPSGCATGYTYDSASRVCQPTPRTPTAAEWDLLGGTQLPVDAAKEIIKQGGSLPVGPSTFSPGSQDLSIGDPYIDPTTGKRYQDKARITPNSTDPSIADVQTVKQEIDANGNPVEVGGIPVSPEEKTEDPCKLNPERMGCKEFGTPEDSVLPSEARGVSAITVQSFAGNATCPPDIQLPKGATLSWSYPCQMATGVRPFLLALAWLAAGLIVIGAVRSS